MKELPDDQHNCAESSGLKLVSVVEFDAQIRKDLGVAKKA